MRFKTDFDPNEVGQTLQHVLFVEGGDGSIDPTVLEALFESNIRIEPLGPSYYVRSVAEALFRYHPTYYFLIDRDHCSDDFINTTWENFPDPTKHNLLVWRRREIENYFLEPDYLIQSTYCNGTRAELERLVLQFASKRLFLDAANQVVVSIREKLKANWIEKFTNPDAFLNKEQAIQALRNTPAFVDQRTKVDAMFSESELEKRFEACLTSMTGGQNHLTFGVGNWLDLIQGKKVFNQVIHSKFFKVEAADKSLLQGREKINEVVKDLLQAQRNKPDDFNTLKRLIEARVKRT